MATPSQKELSAHALRRLGVGGHPELVVDLEDPDSAIATALDLSSSIEVPQADVPETWEEASDSERYWPLFQWWLDRMAAPTRLIEERLTWFWHDHFATSNEKVQNPYLMWQQHRTLRRHATGNFRELLHAMATDPAMLVYLDGDGNNPEELNENFGREVMELHTLGIGQYTQDDVVAAAMSFTGWVINEPAWNDEGVEEGFQYQAEPWSAVFMPEYHAGGFKTLLGMRGRHGTVEALDILLDQPATAAHVAGKLYFELVGIRPDPANATRLGTAFGRDYEILPLIEAITREPAFLSTEAVLAKARSPLEKLITLYQAFETSYETNETAWLLETLLYVPFNPPNPAGYPKGQRLLSPGHLTGAFQLLDVLGEPPEELPFGGGLEALGIYDARPATRRIVGSRRDAPGALVLAFGSPEFALA